MILVALVLGGFGLLMVIGFVILHLQIGGLADELRDARAEDAHNLSVQLDSVVDKQQGHRMDLDRLTNELKTQHEKIGALALHIEGPPSLRHPALPPVSGPARVAGTPR